MKRLALLLALLGNSPASASKDRLEVAVGRLGDVQLAAGDGRHELADLPLTVLLGEAQVFLDAPGNSPIFRVTAETEILLPPDRRPRPKSVARLFRWRSLHPGAIYTARVVHVRGRAIRVIVTEDPVVLPSPQSPDEVAP